VRRLQNSINTALVTTKWRISLPRQPLALPLERAPNAARCPAGSPHTPTAALQVGDPSHTGLRSTAERSTHPPIGLFGDRYPGHGRTPRPELSQLPSHWFEWLFCAAPGCREPVTYR